MTIPRNTSTMKMRHKTKLELHQLAVSNFSNFQNPIIPQLRRSLLPGNKEAPHECEAS